MKHSVIKHLSPFIRPYLRQFFMALLASIVGVLALLGVVQVVRVMVDNALTPSIGASAPLNQIILVFICLTLVMASAIYFRTLYFKMAGERVVADLRDATYGHVLGLDASFFEQNRSGDTTSRLTADVAVLQHTLEASLPIALRGFFQAIGGGGLMVYTSMHLSGIVLFVVAMVMIAAVFFGRIVRRYGKQVQESMADANARITETLQGVRVVQSLNQQQYEHQKLKNILGQQIMLAEKYNKTRAGFFAFATFSIFMAMAVVFWFGGHAVLAGSLSQGELTAFLVYSVVAALGIGSLIEVFSALNTASGAIERIVTLQNAFSEIRDPEKPLNLPKAKTGRKLSGRKLEFHDVTFNYPNQQEPTLKNISFSAHAGEKIAIVGHSGAGKSTLFQLIPRFFDVQQGAITLDGINIKDLSLKELRANVGVVEQDVFLFADTIMENIRYSQPEATDEDVISAAKQAQADGFIKQLSEGYATQIGERGVKLSGGQRQRLAIARTLLASPPLLLLDEATSHLDAESEKAVQDALLKAQQGRTTLAIAHRLATVKSAKTILVLEKGEIVARGTHKELMAKSKLYKRLAELQFIEH